MYRKLLILLTCLLLLTPVAAQDITLTQESTPTLAELPVVEATEEADGDTVINITNTQPEPTPDPIPDADREALFGAVIIGVSVVALGLLVLLGIVLRQYPGFVQTAQESTPPWLDTLIRETLQNVVIDPARTVVQRTPSAADDELFVKIDERFNYLLNMILGAQETAAKPTPTVPAQNVTVNVGESDQGAG